MGRNHLCLELLYSNRLVLRVRCSYANLHRVVSLPKRRCNDSSENLRGEKLFLALCSVDALKWAISGGGILVANLVPGGTRRDTNTEWRSVPCNRDFRRPYIIHWLWNRASYRMVEPISPGWIRSIVSRMWASDYVVSYHFRWSLDRIPNPQRGWLLTLINHGKCSKSIFRWLLLSLS